METTSNTEFDLSFYLLYSSNFQYNLNLTVIEIYIICLDGIIRDRVRDSLTFLI